MLQGAGQPARDPMSIFWSDDSPTTFFVTSKRRSTLGLTPGAKRFLKAARPAAVGTVRFADVEELRNCSCHATKKNVRLRPSYEKIGSPSPNFGKRTGPPSVPA